MFLEKSKKESIKKELYDHIDKKCIFRCNPEVTYFEGFEKGKILSGYPSSKNYTHQFYLRNLTHNPIMLTHISALFLDDLLTKIKNKEEKDYFQLCGLESSSVPLMAAIQMSALKLNININAFTVRKDRKDYGLFNIIDGIPSNAPVIVVDDVINTGSSVGKCLDVCKYELKLHPANNVYCVVKFNKNMEKIKYLNYYANVNSIFSKCEFDVNYDPNKYWFPEDCDRSYNKRPEYVY